MTRLTKVRAGRRGGGWAVGTHGILTSRHVVAGFLGDDCNYCVAALDPRPEIFPCSVVWHDSKCDLALLSVDGERQAWAGAVGADPGPALSKPGTNPLAVQAIGYPNATVSDDGVAPEQVVGTLFPASAAFAGRMPLDVDMSVPTDSLLWQGMSGAAVRDRYGRLVGVVVQVDEDRQARRLYVSLIPDAETNPTFWEALESVGARAVLESSSAPVVRALLTTYDDSGEPYSVIDTPELSAFGARKARQDIDYRGNPYYPYVRRSVDDELSAALSKRVTGTDRRLLLIVGDAMSGKSRAGAEALRGHPELSQLPLLIPDRDVDLQKVTRLVPREGAVLWLDDLNEQWTGLWGALRESQRLGITVVATMRPEQRSRLLDDPTFRSAWDVLGDEALVEQFELPEWCADDIKLLATAEAVIREGVADGRPLGEVLGAADELMKRLKNADMAARAVALSIIDWGRMGLIGGIPGELLETLWIRYLSKKNAAILRLKSSRGQMAEFRQAIEWVTEPIPRTLTMLVKQDDKERFAADDYLVASLHTPIPGHAWEAGLQYATTIEPESLIELGWKAESDGIRAIAGAAYQAAIDVGDPVGVTVAQLMLGSLLEESDPEAARAIYQAATDSGDPGWATRARVALGNLLRESDPEAVLVGYSFQ